MLGKLFESLYYKVFVSIALTRSETIVYIEYFDRNKVVQNFEKKFETTVFNDKIAQYIKQHTNQTPLHYIALLDPSVSQGAVPTCDAKQMRYYTDMSFNKTVCYQNRWAYYTSMSTLEELQNAYKELGVDFIFSPFVLLAQIYKEKLTMQMVAVVLVEDNFLSLGVFDKEELLFAQHLDMEYSSDNDELVIDDEDELNFDLDGGIDLDEVDALDELGDLEDFGDIEDLDAMEEIEEFDEAIETPTKDKKLFDDMPNASKEEGFSEDYQRFLLIKSAVHQFYNDDKYESKFIEHLYIADSVGVSDDLKRYLEEEMFLNPVIRKVDLMQEICDLSKGELK